MPTIWLTQSGYARHRGVTPQAVSNAVKKGRIAGSIRSDGKIDPQIADELWEANTIPISEAQAKGRPTDAARALAREAAERGISLDGGGTMVAHKTLEAEFKAKLAKLEYEERSGKVVDAEAVHKEAFRVARITRDAMLAIPDRLAAELAGMTDPFAIHQKIMVEVRGAIGEVTRIVSEHE